MAEIRTEKLHKSFGSFTAVRDSDFTVADGEFFCLLGPSGCGKTTTLRMIAGLELPTSGRILLGDEDVTLKRAEIRTSVEAAARILRITHLLDRRVSGLASGDRQRVALGRSIVRQPMAFMMDEPLGALDAELRHVMTGELRALHNRLRATTIYVTHDQLEAMALADKIAVMNHGVIEQLGTPREIYQRPVSLFVADFIVSPPLNFLAFLGGLLTFSAAVRLGERMIAVPQIREDVAERELVLGVRPEDVRLSDGGAVRGEVFGAEYLG